MVSVLSFLFKNFYLLIIAATKFMFTTTTAKVAGLNFYEAFSVTALGGIMGYFFFYYLLTVSYVYTTLFLIITKS